MKKLLILLVTILLSTNLFAEPINEYKSDIYFANGVGAIDYDTSFEQGEVQIKKYKKANTEFYRNYVGKYDLAYNIGRGIVRDFAEAWFQYIDENPGYKVGWDAFKAALSRSIGSVVGGTVELSEQFIRYLEQNNVDTQVKAYRQSIYDGHKVIVLAHSQGNLFTNRAYNTFANDKDRWMQKYFVTIGLASPSDKKITNSEYYTYDNDPIVVLNGAGEVVRNPKRYYAWVAGPDAIVDSTTTSPCISVVVNDGDTPYCRDVTWLAEEAKYVEFHSFDYYMDTPLTRDKVYSFLTNAISEHLTASSQWKFKESATCKVSGCENVLREVEHKEDTSLNNLIAGDVYPFNEENGKIYPVTGHGYVMASYGGVGIEEPSDNQDVCYELKDENDATIEAIQACYIPSQLYSLAHSTYYSNTSSIINAPGVVYSGAGESWHLDLSNVMVVLEYNGEQKVFKATDAVAVYKPIGDINHGGSYQTSWYNFVFIKDGKKYGVVPNPGNGKTPNENYYRGYEYWWNGELIGGAELHYQCTTCYGNDTAWGKSVDTKGFILEE